MLVFPATNITSYDSAAESNPECSWNERSYHPSRFLLITYSISPSLNRPSCNKRPVRVNYLSVPVRKIDCLKEKILYFEKRKLELAKLNNYWMVAARIASSSRIVLFDTYSYAHLSHAIISFAIYIQYSFIDLLIFCPQKTSGTFFSNTPMGSRYYDVLHDLNYLNSKQVIWVSESGSLLFLSFIMHLIISSTAICIVLVQ